MTKQNVLSSNVAATPLSFGSPGIGCKPRIVSRLNYNLEMLVFVEGGKPEYPEKNAWSRDENQQQTQPR